MDRSGLVGANGAGKTTLFRLMLGLLFPTSGSVEVVGHSVASRSDRHPQPARVHARARLPVQRPVGRRLRGHRSASSPGFLPAPRDSRASDVLDLVGLDESRFRPVGGFSTGMRQRVKLAQALVADPELVLLDEPTAGLDPVGREEMLDLVGRLSTFGISVLFATHLLDDVQRVCEHVVMVDAGRLVLAGPVEELVERTGAVRVEVGGRAGGCRGVDRPPSPRTGSPCRSSTSRPSTSTPPAPATPCSTSFATRAPTSDCACTGCRAGTARSTSCSSPRQAAAHERSVP